MESTPTAEKPAPPADDPRTYLAAERTFLAWIRTGLALMGFGFILARFGLFLRQIQLFQHETPIHSTGVSLWLGTLLVFVGVAVNIAAILHHMNLVRGLNAGNWDFRKPSRTGIAVAVILAAIGLIMAIYLTLVH